MTIFRHVNTKRLYNLYVCSPRGYLGEWIQSEDIITKQVRNLNSSSWKRSDFVAVAVR